MTDALFKRASLSDFSNNYLFSSVSVMNMEWNPF